MTFMTRFALSPNGELSDPDEAKRSRDSSPASGWAIWFSEFGAPSLGVLIKVSGIGSLAIAVGVPLPSKTVHRVCPAREVRTAILVAALFVPVVFDRSAGAVGMINVGEYEVGGNAADRIIEGL
jgi:hypothetical protein